jgi:hypothetical protein
LKKRSTTAGAAKSENLFGHDGRDEKQKRKSLATEGTDGAEKNFSKDFSPSAVTSAFLNRAMTVPFSRHSRGSGNPVRDLRPEGLQIQKMRRFAPECTHWIPAFAGMTMAMGAAMELARATAKATANRILARTEMTGKWNGHRLNRKRHSHGVHGKARRKPREKSLFLSVFSVNSVVNAFHSCFSSCSPRTSRVKIFSPSAVIRAFLHRTPAHPRHSRERGNPVPCLAANRPLFPGFMK